MLRNHEEYGFFYSNATGRAAMALLFADDTTLISTSLDDPERQVDDFCTVSRARLNRSKCKALPLNSKMMAHPDCVFHTSLLRYNTNMCFDYSFSWLRSLPVDDADRADLQAILVGLQQAPGHSWFFLKHIQSTAAKFQRFNCLHYNDVASFIASLLSSLPLFSSWARIMVVNFSLSAYISMAMWACIMVVNFFTERLHFHDHVRVQGAPKVGVAPLVSEGIARLAAAPAPYLTATHCRLM
ncbi:hypothetical protein H257_19036 [Aphanomyces astaci]|uniref:Reverse transcriptase domain-containing protein n=1 Tax=Aphanomyces astaci TaxID=112090 RepID=W4FBD8_APHAT|nr:hypothetical protein H257_19036 [Aphanomyces astaci]ETV64023.1 hypothetical protein H257_19036 [Aphanomyces astaci]|eukprot:XP_009846491.1 hypothetical protein H257_19036 [Aphanomyces astaci]